MQLKELAKVSDATKTFNDIVNNGTVSNIAFKNALAGLSTQEKINIVSQSALNETQKIGALASAGLTSEELKQTVQNGSLAASQTVTTDTTLGLGTAFKGLWISIKSTTAAMWTFLTTNPIGWAVLAASAIAGLAFGVKKYNDSIEEAKEAARERTSELLNEFKELNNTLAEHKKTANELADKYDELSKGVNHSNNRNISLSTEEYDEFLNINKQLAETFPELAKGIDENGNSILALGENGITAKEKLEELLQTEENLNNFRIAQGLGDAFKGVYTYVEDAYEAADEFKGFVNDSNKSISKLQNIAENGVKLNGEYGQLLIKGSYQNEADLAYMDTLTSSVNEFWESLAPLRQGQLGIDSSSLIRQEFDDNTNTLNLYADTFNLSSDEIKTLEDIINGNLKIAHKTFKDSVGDQSQKFREQMQQGENAWRDFIPNLVSGMKSKQTFKDLDSDLQDIAVQIVEGLDYGYASAMNEYNPNDPYAYIRDKFIVPMGDLNEDDKKKYINAFTKLMTLDPEDISDKNRKEITKLVDTITTILGEDTLDINVALGFDVGDDAKKRLDNSIHQITSEYGIEDREQVAELTKYTKDFTLSQVELWIESTQGAENATQAIEMYEHALNNTKKSANETPISSFEDAWANSFTSGNDKVKELGNTLLGLAEKGRLTKEMFEETDSARYFKNLGISADEAVSKTNALVDESKQLSSMSDQISKMSNALGTKNSNGFVDADTLAGFDVEVRGLEAWDRFQTLIGNSTSSYKECEEAASALATEWVNSSDFLAQLTEENKEYYETQLKAMSIENYEELISYAQALNEAKDALAQSSLDLSTATAEEIQTLIDEGEYSKLTQQQIWALYASKLAEQASSIDSSADRQQFLNLANDANLTTETIRLLTEMMSIYSDLESGVYSKSGRDREYAYERISQIKSEIEALANGEGKGLIVEPTVKLNNKIKSSEKSSQKDLWLEEYKKKLVDLQTLLDQELINEKEFYEQSDALLNEHLKDTPAHIQKYADEISNAEKTLRGNWISSFGYEKSQLEKDLSDNALVQWQYYEQLSELAEKYYNTEGASYGKFADEYDEITREIKEGQEKLWEDIFGEINTQLDDLQSACETVGDAVTEYSENGSLSIDTMQKLIDLEPQYMAMLFDENGQLQLNAEAYERLAKTKLEEMKVDLANQALNTINGLENETQAVELLTGKYAELRDTSLDAVEARLQFAIAEAHERGEKQGQAADMMMQVYQNQKNVIDMTDFSLPSLTNSENDKSEKEFLKTFDWIGTLLEKISDKTSKLIDKVDKFYSWQKKNTMINRAVKATDKEINQNERAYQSYMKKANSVGLSLSYVNKVQNGTLSLEDITNEALADKIDAYQDWYDKAQSCLDTIEDLYDKQRDLIRQKLDNVLEYYSDMDSYLSSVTSKIESLISLNDEMGKRTSLTELVEQFASISDQLESVTAKNTAGITVAEGSLGDSKKVTEADGTAAKQTEADRLKGEIDNIQSDLENTATYQNLLKTIERTEGTIAELDRTGYDRLTKGQKKTYDKLKAQLEDYYAQKESLDENATAANIAEYNKTYLAWKKLQDKLDSGKNLSESQWKQYNSYTKQLENFADEKADTISELNNALAELDPSDKLGQIKKTYEESAQGINESYQNQISSLNGETENTKQYQNLLAKVQKLEQKKDTKGLSKSEQAKLDKYNAELEALQTGATGNNIADYIKTWEAWYKLEQKLDNGKKLSNSEAKKYDTYKAQLEAWNNEKQTQISDLLSLMEEDLEQFEKTYTEKISEAESEIDDYYANLYSLAKQIAEYNLTTLQAQLTAIESCISYYKELVSLYDSFDGGKLVKILKDLGEVNADDEVSSRLDLYSDYFDQLQKKYDATLSQINEYNQLLDALDTDDFEASMDLFNKAMEGYRSEGNNEMADKLQSVLNLLNERAADADNWDEYADEWANEWKEALSSVKQDLIGTATEIQNVNDALREIRFENITDAIEELDRASGILSSIESLIQDDWLFEPDGTLSEYGRAKAALLVSQLEDAQSKANEYLKLYNEIQNNQDTYASDKAYKAALNEALQNYYDSLNSAASFENSIRDLMKQNAEEEINSLKDVIEARKKALQSKKEYYDYDKSIKNSQKEIDSLKAQIDALESLSDATDAATKAKLAQLKAELAEKEDALQETKDEHTFNLQIDALEKFAESLTDALDESTKSVEEILKEQTQIVESAKDLCKTSADGVNDTLDKIMAFYSGMGMSIDGADFVPNTVYDNTANTDLGLDNAKTDAVGKFIAEASEAFKNGVLVRTSDAQILKVFDENMLDYLQTNLPPVFNAAQPIPDYINYIREREETPTVVNNNHYDCLLNVEGNVDKDALPDLQTILERSCEYTKNNIHEELITTGHMKVSSIGYRK